MGFRQITTNILVAWGLRTIADNKLYHPEFKFRFVPEPDITVFELALVFQQLDTCITQERYAALPENVKRFFPRRDGDCGEPCHPDAACDSCAEYWQRMKSEGYWDSNGARWTDKGWGQMRDQYDRQRRHT